MNTTGEQGAVSEQPTDGGGGRETTAADAPSRVTPGPSHGDSGDGEEDEVEEDTFEIKLPPNPVKPPAAEVEEHNKTHTPYRSWCDICNEGRGLGEVRGRHAGRDHDIATVGVD